MKIGFIGCGNMGEAILAGVHAKHACRVCEARPERRAFLKKEYRVAFGALAEVVAAVDVIILSVKPQDLGSVLEALRGRPLGAKLFISIAAGIRTASLEKALGRGARVVRVMPNLPAMVGEGMSGICRGKKATAADLASANVIFNAVGRTVIVPERLMDAVTAVSGSGPAYVFFFAECLMQAARQLGFNAREARELVCQTLAGSVRMLSDSSDPADVLRRKVTSKGGTTEAALAVLENKDMAGVLTAALKAARDRAGQLSK